MGLRLRDRGRARVARLCFPEPEPGARHKPHRPNNAASIRVAERLGEKPGEDWEIFGRRLWFDGMTGMRGRQVVTLLSR